MSYDNSEEPENLEPSTAADSEPAQSVPETPREPDTIAPVEVAEAEPELSQQEQQMLERVQQCDFGTWFEFMHEGDKGKPLRLKLAWASKVTQHCMFVDYAGGQKGQ